jgi:hypothetical protein
VGLSPQEDDFLEVSMVTEVHRLFLKVRGERGRKGGGEGGRGRKKGGRAQGSV